MDITIDRDAEIPIGVQLAWALRSRIANGTFAAHARLPGLRELAASTGVNVNTVRVVYQRLEQEGLLDSQQGSGTFVAAAPQRRSAVSTIAADAAREALHTGVDPREVAAALYVLPGTPANAASEASERRRSLRAQIATLERTLGELEASHPGVAPAVAQTPADAGPTLLDAVSLELVRATLVRRLALVQAAIDGLGEDDAAAPEKKTVKDTEVAPAVKRRRAPRAAIRPVAEGA